ncbi:TPA: sialidase, partial [Staphylococcus pseudintermedius]|nr:sialidase [Staphylococcus pseudintermedius]
MLAFNQEVRAENNPVKDQSIFKSGDTTQANYFRIPALYTLSNGEMIASADARYGGTHDAKSKINIATSTSFDGKNWTSPTFALQFHDYESQLIDWPRDNVGKNRQIQGSASFIDSAIVQDKNTNKIFLMADMMPAGIGNNNALKSDSGFKEINGKYYLKLKLNNEKGYNYSIRENGTIFNDKNNNPTIYSVDRDYNILKNNEYQYVTQYSVKFNG